jgi:hypothetical protein
LGWRKVAAALRQYEIMMYGAVATKDWRKKRKQKQFSYDKN